MDIGQRWTIYNVVQEDKFIDIKSVPSVLINRKTVRSISSKLGV